MTWKFPSVWTFLFVSQTLFWVVFAIKHMPHPKPTGPQFCTPFMKTVGASYKGNRCEVRTVDARLVIACDAPGDLWGVPRQWMTECAREGASK